jgi:hypothetical protein
MHGLVKFGQLRRRLPLVGGPGDLGIPFRGWYGFRGFKSASVGSPAFKLRRSSDSATSDINILAGGVQDIATITSFKGGASLSIAEIYDLTGNGFHAIPPAQINEGPFTQNLLNGMGGFDNSAGTPGVSGPLYVAANDPVDFNSASLGSLSMYAVINSTDPTFSYASFMASNNNEWTGLDVGNLFPHNHLQFEVKNEGGVEFSLQQTTGISINNWYAWASTLYFQPSGSNSFFNINNAITSAFGDLSDTNLETTNNHFCFLGDENPNPWIGYCVEAGWYMTLGSGLAGWTLAQTQAIISNARSFWNF